MPLGTSRKLFRKTKTNKIMIKTATQLVRRALVTGSGPKCATGSAYKVVVCSICSSIFFFFFQLFLYGFNIFYQNSPNSDDGNKKSKGGETEKNPGLGFEMPIQRLAGNEGYDYRPRHPATTLPENFQRHCPPL